MTRAEKRALTPFSPAASEKTVISGPAGAIETLVETPGAAPVAAAVACHPHPLHDGTMTNKVVHTLARAFRRSGAVSIRFNFRGVGESAGTHSGGSGELADALAVVSWARAAYPGLPLYLGGFSFGAAIAASAAVDVDAAVLVTVAPPVARLPETLEVPAVPWLIVHGSEDELVPVHDVRTWRDRHAPRASLIVLEGATHFFHGRLTELSEHVASFVADAVAPRGTGPRITES